MIGAKGTYALSSCLTQERITMKTMPLLWHDTQGGFDMTYSELLEEAQKEKDDLIRKYHDDEWIRFLSDANPNAFA